MCRHRVRPWRLVHLAETDRGHPGSEAGRTLPAPAAHSRNWPLDVASSMQVVATSQGTSCMVS
jgi:hypothetical protein